jgi:hypothetical protein
MTFANVADFQTDLIIVRSDDHPISATGVHLATTLKRSTWFDAATTT